MPIARRTSALGLLIALAAAVPALGYLRPGSTEEVALGTAPSLSGDGRLVAFLSTDPSLTGDPSGDHWVVVLDRASGASTALEPVRDAGETRNSPPWHAPSLSADGRHVAFTSAVDPATGAPSPRFHVRVHDLATGSTRVVTPGETPSTNDYATRPSLSADGRYLAFESTLPGLVPGDTNVSPDIFVLDRVTDAVQRVSVSSDGSQGNNSSTYSKISSDGRAVVFLSYSTNLVPADTNAKVDAFVHDRLSGRTERVSVTTGGGQANDQSLHPSISADGRFVAFWSLATNLTSEGGFHAFVHDRETGRTERVSISSDGSRYVNMCGGGECSDGTGASSQPAISAGGRFVAFQSQLSTLMEGDTNARQDVFVHDRLTGVTERVSTEPDGAQRSVHSASPAISGDGRVVAFADETPDPSTPPGRLLVRDRGPAIGVADLAAASAGAQVLVSGTATFSGAVVGAAHDPLGDAEPGAFELGAELVRATLVYRPEQEDLLLRWRLAFLTTRINPGVLYGLDLTVGGVPHQVRAVRAGVEGIEVRTAPPSVAVAQRVFALYRCQGTCTEVARLRGGGQVDEVMVAIPLARLGAAEGAAISGVRAFTALGEIRPGAARTLDELAVPTSRIPGVSVSLGVTEPGAAAPETFDVPASVGAGSFSALLPLPPGQHEVWARACLGADCGVDSTRFTVE